METTQNPKIRFYIQRPFGEKMNASFDFLKENLKPIFKYVTYLLLPICLIQALSLNTFVEGYIQMFMSGSPDTIDMARISPTSWLSYIITLLCGYIGTLLFCALIAALIKLYNEREDRLKNLTFGILRPVLFRNLGRLFLIGIVLYFIMIVAVGVVALFFFITSFSILLTIPLLVAFIVAIMPCVPVYLYENIGLFASIAKGIRLGFATWGGVFAILFIMGLIASIFMGVVATPYYVAVFIKMLLVFSTDTGVYEISVFYSFLIYILGVLFVFGSYISAIFAFLGISYQYAHAVEKVDSITVEDDIENFENL